MTVYTQAVAHYVYKNKSAEPLLLAVHQSRLRLQPIKSLSEFKSEWLQECMILWKQKLLHGQFLVVIKCLTTVECAYKWLRWSYLKLETEVLITATQDHALLYKCI